MPRINGPEYPATIGIMRQALHMVLQKAMAQAQAPIRLGVTVQSLEQDEAGVSIAFSDGIQGRYDLVVGADGAYSKICDMLFGPEWRPRFTSQAVWRATVRRPPEVLARTSYQGPRHKAGYNPVSQTQMYIYFVQNLPGPVRLADDDLVPTLRELLSDFGGVLAKARDEIVDPKSHCIPPDHVADHAAAVVPRPRASDWADAVHTTTPHMAAGAGIAESQTLVVLAELLASGSSLAAVPMPSWRGATSAVVWVVQNSFQLGEWEKTPNAPGRKSDSQSKQETIRQPGAAVLGVFRTGNNAAPSAAPSPARRSAARRRRVTS